MTIGKWSITIRLRQRHDAQRLYFVVTPFHGLACDLFPKSMCGAGVVVVSERTLVCYFWRLGRGCHFCCAFGIQGVILVCWSVGLAFVSLNLRSWGKECWLLIGNFREKPSHVFVNFPIPCDYGLLDRT